MELPHLGKHCSEQGCNKLDFLPVKCDGCNKVYCGDHYKYTGHNCPNAYKKDLQVPICPLCGNPIPGKADELPDIRVSRHIDNDCKSDTAKSRRQKVYSNKCTLKGCKNKEAIPILCDKCNLNFCLKHRHPQDHQCTKQSEKSVGKAGQAALARVPAPSSSGRAKSSHNTGSIPNGITRPVVGNRAAAALQGNMTEDQALQMALQASLGPSTPAQPSNRALTQEQEDFLLARAIAESEREAAVAGGASSSRSRRRSHPTCEIS